MKQNVCFVFFILLVSFVNVYSQQINIVSIQPAGLQVLFSSATPITSNQQKIISNRNNYRLYETVDSIPVEDLTSLIVNAEIDCGGLAFGECMINSTSLISALKIDKKYLLVIKGPEEKDKPISRVFGSSTGKILPSKDYAKRQTELRLVPPALIDNPNSIKTVQRTVLLPSGDGTSVNPASPGKLEIPVVATPEDPKDVSNPALILKLERKLPDGETYFFSVPQIKLKNFPKSIDAEGKIGISSGLSANPKPPRFTIGITSSSAAKQKAVFDFKFKYAVTNNPNYPVKWQPFIDIDVGLRSTKSKNAIVFSYLYSSIDMVCDPTRIKIVDKKGEVLFDDATRKVETVSTSTDFTGRICSAPKTLTIDPLVKGATLTQTYAKWKNTPWYNLAYVERYVGPKVEIDRSWKRVNLLGNVRFAYNFDRLLGSIAYKREKILNSFIDDDKKDADSKLKGIIYGFKLVPYANFDFGGRVTGETIEKKITVNGSSVLTSAAVPRHKILRSYFGATGGFEWNTFDIPTTLSFDYSIGYMVFNEFSGYSNNQGAFLRRIKGFQPRFITSFDFALDPAKHYNFTISYENGRSAPNFEYLNKLDAGIKVVY